MSRRFEAPKGTFDQLPPASGSRAEVERIMLEQARLAGYEPIETPIFEDTAVFARGVGEATDVVQKEMYTFSDKGGRSLTLRPELTAGVVRALIEHGRLTTGLTKVVCSGPQFRYERPQAGRQRQFSQVDIEAMGSDAPAIDADVVLVGHEVFRRLEIPVTLLLTSLGDPVCRPAYREALLAFLHGLGDKLPAAARARAEQNPLRVLDMKDPLVEELTAEAPLMRDYLCGACKAHDEAVRELLAGVGVEWAEAPGWSGVSTTTSAPPSNGRPGRWTPPRTRSGAAAATTGCRRPWAARPPPDRLGPRPRPHGARPGAGRPPPGRPWRLDALVLPLVPAAVVPAQGLVRDLRRAGLVADLPYAERTLNGHMKAAAKAGARTVVILGEQELDAGQAAVRDMTAATSAVPSTRSSTTCAGSPAEVPMTRPCSAPCAPTPAGACGPPTPDRGPAGRLGGPPARPRRGGLPRPARRLRGRAGGGPPRRGTGRGRHPDRGLRPGRGHGQGPPGRQREPELPTGEVEVAADAVEVLAPSETPPFPLEGRTDADETLRLQYRYLDLRRRRPGAAWRSGPPPTPPCAGSSVSAASSRSRPRT